MNIQYSPESINDLYTIFGYISDNLSSPGAAKNICDGIIEKIDLLEQMPEIGTKIFWESGIFSGYRYITFKNYLTVYQIIDDNIYIYRIINGRRDYIKLLFS